MFRHVSESHEGRKQHRHWQCKRHHGQCSERKKFGDHVPVKSFSDQFIHPFPQKLHEEDEDRDDERQREGRQVAFEDESAERFQ